MPYAFTPNHTYTPRPQFKPAPAPAPWSAPVLPRDAGATKVRDAILNSLILAVPVGLFLGVSWLVLNF